MKKSPSSPIQIFVLIPLAMLLFGCVTFDLGTVLPVSGQSVAQRDSDMAVCKVKAYEAANTKERQAGAFIAGMTIVGAPLAIEDEKKLQRKIFKECLEERGYAVEPPADKQTPSAAGNVAGTSKTSGPKTNGKFRISIGSSNEWIDEKITDDLKNSGAIIHKANYGMDAGLLISRIKTSYIKEPSKYVETTKSFFAATMKEMQTSDTKIVEINGIQYAQYEVWGTVSSGGTDVPLKYLSFIAVDKEEIFAIRFWTLAHNFDFQRPVFEELMKSVSIPEPLKVLTAANSERSNLTPNQIKQKCKNLGFLEGTDEYAACLGEILSREK